MGSGGSGMTVSESMYRMLFRCKVAFAILGIALAFLYGCGQSTVVPDGACYEIVMVPIKDDGRELLMPDKEIVPCPDEAPLP